MVINVKEPPEQSAASLMCGILGDLQILIEQQFQLTRREIEEELRERALATAVLALGASVCFLGCIALCLTLAHLLHWVASPPGTDPAWLPLWACHAVTAAALAITGGALVKIGLARFHSVDPCKNPATEIFQEHPP